MSRYALRLPDSLFEAAKALAEQEHTSLNQLCVTAIHGLPCGVHVRNTP